MLALLVALHIGLPISEVAVSPDGKVVATCDRDHGFAVFEAATGKRLTTRRELKCTALVFAPDSTRAIVRRESNDVVVAIPSGKTLQELTGTAGAEILADGRLIVVEHKTDSSRAGELWTSDVFEVLGKTRRSIAHVAAYVQQISPDGKQLVLEDGRIVEVGTGATISNVPRKVSQVYFIGPRSWLALTAGEWPDVIAWSAGATATELASSSAARAKERGEGVGSVDVPPPFDIAYVQTTEKRGLLAIDLATGKLLWSSSFIHDMRRVARHGDELVVQEFLCATRLDLDGGLKPGPALCAHRPAVVGFANDGTIVTRPWFGGGAIVFDRGGALVSTNPSALPFAADGATLVRLASDAKLAVRVAAALALPKVEQGPVLVSDDGKWLFVNGSQQHGSIIELATLHARAALMPLCAARDGSRYAIQRDDATEIRRTSDDRVIATIHASLSDCAMSADGALFATRTHSGSDESEKWTLEIYETTSGKKVFEVASLEPYAFSHDGTKLGVGTTIYSLVTKRELRHITDPGGDGVDVVQFSDDGKHYAIGEDRLTIIDL